jgi:hypothetical protein
MMGSCRLLGTFGESFERALAGETSYLESQRMSAVRNG